MARSELYTNVYDLDYFCLTNQNILLVKRSDSLLQINPSEFQDGDQILTLDSDNNAHWVEPTITLRNVSKSDKIIRLVTQRGTFYTTVGHKMFLADNTLTAAGNLKEGDLLRFTDSLANVLPTNKSIGIDKAFALGAFSAEGHSLEGLSAGGTGKWRLCWNLHLDEDIFAIKILTHLTSAFPNIKAQIDLFPDQTGRKVFVFNKELVLTFKEYGALGLCENKRVPSMIFSATPAEKAAYLAGLIEGDSTWNKSRVVIGLTSKALIDGAHILFNSLGIRTCLNSSKTDDLYKYTLSIYGKDNLNKFLCLCSSYLYGWKHLTEIQKYAGSQHGNIKQSALDVQNALKAVQHPISLTEFSKQGGIPQNTIKRIYGSWNQCLIANGYIPKRHGRWGRKHTPDNLWTRSQQIINDIPLYNKVQHVEFVTLDDDIVVYDFTVPNTENFLLNTICSHNSGSQMYLYVGDVWIDEITSLQYTTQQMKQPIYGYASQLFDDCAAGHVIVQGAFTINFKEQGYLWAVLRRYQKVMGADIGFNTKHDNSLMRTNKGSSRNQPDLTNSNGVRVGSNGTQISRQPIEGMVNGNLTRGQQYQFYQDLAGYATFNTKQAKDKVFEDIAEAFEDQIWKKGVTDEDLISQVRRPDDNIFDNFDMYVVFGNMANPQANHTVQKIIGVRLISQGKSIMVGGQPIQEEYSFIARTTA